MKATVVFVIAVIAVVASSAFVYIVALRKQGKRARSVSRVRGFRGRGNHSIDDPFVGRDEEQQRFRDLLRQWATDGSTAERMLIVCGPSGIGKRSLLQCYDGICRSEGALRCGPVLGPDSETALDQLSIMETIAGRLQDLQSGAFSSFFDAFDRLSRKSSGMRTPVGELIDAARSTTKAASQLGVPGFTAASTALAIPLVDRAAEGFGGSSDLGDVELAFLADLGQLAANVARAPVVLFFDDLDRWPDDRGRGWLTTTLFPRLAGSRVLFVVSVESDDLVARLQSVTKTAVLLLPPLSSSEARGYVTSVIRLTEAAQIDQVVERSEGLPGRLAGYRSYFDRHPESRQHKGVPTEADAWALSTSVAQLLERVQDPHLRNVVLASSALRWFNAALLDEIATALGLEPGDEKRRAADLVGEVRPSWIVNRDLGWGVTLERLALLDHARRLDPGQLGAVHIAAAWHHYRRLCELDGQVPVPNNGDATALLTYRSQLPAVERRDDRDHTAHLAELAYHLLALYPDRALGFVADHAAEALFDAEGALAESLLDVGPELSLPVRHRFYLGLLRRCATAVRLDQPADAVKALEELTAAGSPTDLVTAVTQYVLGEKFYQLGRELESLVAFEQACELLDPLSKDNAHAMRMRCIAVTWRAQGLMQLRGGFSDEVSTLLDDAERAAIDLGDSTLIGEMRRARAVILDDANQLQNAADSYLRCLSDFRAARRPGEVASSHLGLASVLSKLERYDEAAKQLDDAAAIFDALGDAESQAGVARGRLNLLLAKGDHAAADKQRDALIAMRPTDAHHINLIGVLYSFKNLHYEAGALFERAVKIERAPLFLGNLARNRRGQGLPEEAVKLYREAIDLAPTDTASLLELAELLKETNEIEDARSSARTLCDVLLHALPGVGRLPPVVADRLQRALDVLTIEDAGQILATAVTRYPADAGLHFRLARLRRQGITASMLDGESALDHLKKARLLASTETTEPVTGFISEQAEVHMDLDDWEAAAVCVDDLDSETDTAGLERRLRRFRRSADRETTPPPLDWPISVRVSSDLRRWVDPDSPLAARLYDSTGLITELRELLQTRVGLWIPGIRFRADDDLPPGTVRVIVHGVLVAEIHLAADYLASDPARCATVLSVSPPPAILPWDGSAGAWANKEQAAQLADTGVLTWNAGGIILSFLAVVIEQHAASFVRLVDGQVKLASSSDDARGPVPSAVASHLASALRRGLTEHRETDGDAWMDELVSEALASANEERSHLPPISDSSLPAEDQEMTDRVVEPSAPEQLAGLFTTDRWEQKAVARPVSLIVSLSPELVRAAGDSAVDIASQAVRICTRALALGDPAITMSSDETLSGQTCIIEVGGVTRVAFASLPLWPDGWAGHPSAGSAGRTGLAVEANPPLASLVRAVEEAVWDDPSLLVDPEEEMADIRAHLAHLHLGLVDANIASEAWSVDPTITLERVAMHLRSTLVVLRAGSELHGSISPEAVDHLHIYCETLVDSIESRTGISLPSNVAVELDEDLGDSDFELVLDGLPRARGTASPSDDIESAIGAVLAICLNDAITDYVDSLWMEQHLLRMSRQDPVLVAALRETFSVEFMAAVVRRLVAGGMSARNGTLFERLIEIDEGQLLRGRNADAWAELLRVPAPGYVPWPLVVTDQWETWALQAGPKGLWPVSAWRPARSPLVRQLLFTLDRTLASRPFGQGACLVVDRSIRGAVARVVSAQFPELLVAAEDELPPGLNWSPLTLDETPPYATPT